MRTFVKICGLSEREHVLAAIEAGADAIGFVFVNSVRRVSIEKAINISHDIDSHVKRVAVFYKPELSSWNRVIEEFKPDAVQTDFKDFSIFSVPDAIEKWPVYRENQKNMKFIKIKIRSAQNVNKVWIVGKKPRGHHLWPSAVIFSMDRKKSQKYF